MPAVRATASNVRAPPAGGSGAAEAPHQPIAKAGLVAAAADRARRRVRGRYQLAMRAQARARAAVLRRRIGMKARSGVVDSPRKRLLLARRIHQGDRTPTAAPRRT